MGEFKGTPGPWTVFKGRSCTYIFTSARDEEDNEYGIACPGSGGAMSYTSQVCVLNWHNTEEWCANARLIAAAPELLEALVRLESHTRVLPEDMDAAGSVLAQARAAICKATDEG